jgi:8-oxo-dGTP pyrophosphatase MutT (NUDIX family)
LEKKFSEFISALQTNLEHELPGEEAQYRMAPVQRLTRTQLLRDTGSTVNASVLILLYPLNGQAHFLLTERCSYDGVHSGQISLPGGKVDPDELFFNASAREAEEEVGIPAHSIKPLGPLTDLIIPASKFRVYPFIGYLNDFPSLSVNPKEVRSIRHVKVTDLLNPRLKSVQDFHASLHRKVQAPFYRFSEFEVWGATAMILSEFEEILKRTLKI